MSQAEKEERFVSVFQSDFATSVFADVRSDALRLAVDNFRMSAAAALTEIKKMYDFPRDAVVDLGVSEEGVLNARARYDSDTGHYRIEFTTGYLLWAVIVAGYLALLVRSEFRAERRLTLSFKEFEEDLKTLGAKEILNRAIPEIPREIEGSFLFFLESVYLPVLFHECSHVVRGHLPLLRRYRSQASLCVLDELMVRRVGETPTAFPLRDVEVDADIFGASLSSEFAFARSSHLGRWRHMTGKENLFAEFVGYALFVAGQERLAKELVGSSVQYPSPQFRLIIHSVGHQARWIKENPSGNYFEDVLTPGFELLAPLEPAFPEIDMFRDIADGSESSDLRREVDQYFARTAAEPDGIIAKQALTCLWDDPLPPHLGLL